MTEGPSPGARGRRWALVTGASSGIGEALARELHRRDHHLVLVGRDEERLARLADELGGEDRKPRVFARDLASGDAATEIHAALDREDIPVSVLVNNAGHAVHGPFASTDVRSELDLVDVQVKAMLRLVKAFLPGMVSRGHGRILNVGSVYSFFSVAHQSVYAACKAFMLSFSESLGTELRGTGVSVTVVCPGVTRTRFRSRAGMEDRPSRSAMSPEAVAVLACRGLFAGKSIVIPGARNRLYVMGSKLLPRRLFSSLLRRVNEKRGLGAGT